jgi:hypothetical protein
MQQFNVSDIAAIGFAIFRFLNAKPDLKKRLRIFTDSCSYFLLAQPSTQSLDIYFTLIRTICNIHVLIHQVILNQPHHHSRVGPDRLFNNFDHLLPAWLFPHPIRSHLRVPLGELDPLGQYHCASPWKCCLFNSYEHVSKFILNHGWTARRRRKIYLSEVPPRSGPGTATQGPPRTLDCVCVCVRPKLNWQCVCVYIHVHVYVCVCHIVY